MIDRWTDTLIDRPVQLLYSHDNPRVSVVILRGIWAIALSFTRV